MNDIKTNYPVCDGCDCVAACSKVKDKVCCKAPLPSTKSAMTRTTYIFLEPGDVIQEGDEFYYDYGFGREHTWQKAIYTVGRQHLEHHGIARRPITATPQAAPIAQTREPLTDEWIDTVMNEMPDGALGFMKSWGYRQFARAILNLRKIPEWEPDFACNDPEQEALAQSFCLEIAGKRGQKGSPPDPVRIMEMAHALYVAERNSAHNGITGVSK